jgi:hypothetical protein
MPKTATSIRLFPEFVKDYQNSPLPESIILDGVSPFFVIRIEHEIMRTRSFRLFDDDRVRIPLTQLEPIIYAIKVAIDLLSCQRHEFTLKRMSDHLIAIIKRFINMNPHSIVEKIYYYDALHTLHTWIPAKHRSLHESKQDVVPSLFRAISPPISEPNSPEVNPDSLALPATQRQLFPDTVELEEKSSNRHMHLDTTEISTSPSLSEAMDISPEPLYLQREHSTASTASPCSESERALASSPLSSSPVSQLHSSLTNGNPPPHIDSKVLESYKKTIREADEKIATGRKQIAAIRNDIYRKTFYGENQHFFNGRGCAHGNGTKYQYSVEARMNDAEKELVKDMHLRFPLLINTGSPFNNIKSEDFFKTFFPDGREAENALIKETEYLQTNRDRLALHIQFFRVRDSDTSTTATAVSPPTPHKRTRTQ